MSTRERLTLAAALAVALGAAAVAPLYDGLDWLPRALGAIAAVALTGLVCRRLSVPALLQPLAALLVLFEYVAFVFVHDTLALGLFPTGRTAPALRALIEQGLDDVERLAPPVPNHPGLTLLAVLGVAAVAIAVDVIAVLLGRAALAGLALLVLFAVPSAVRPGGLGWLPFTLGAVGWLFLLLVEGADRVNRWGTPLKSARPDRSAYEDSSLGRVGRRIGAAALGVAVVVPAMIPGLDARLLGGHGDGPGQGGSRTTTTYDPLTRLAADLRLPTPRLILTYTTTDADPDYLRLTTLDQFTDEGWSASRLTGSPKRNGVAGPLPPPVGLTDDTETRPVRAHITIKNLSAQWLPAPFPPRKVSVAGPWLYDRRSETIFGIRVGTKKLKKGYTVDASRVVPDRTTLVAVPNDQPPASVADYAVAPDVTEYVRLLTNRVIGKATTPYGKVAAIQAFFHDPAQKFEYDDTSTVPGIDTPSDLENFLRGRRGFCEQYASAMGAMIRLAGVPGRVAVGFTKGTLQGDNSYAVTTSNAHAWPEAWFAGTGWVRFEPTPRDGQADIPGYAVAPVPGANGAVDPVTGAPSDEAVPLNEPLDADRANRPDPDSQLVLPSPDEGAGQGSGWMSLWRVALVAAALLLVLPGVLHQLRRRRRWTRPSPLVAWQQLCDDGVDVGHAWRRADSPRAAAAHLAATRGLAEPARAALDRLAVAAERARYARAAGDTGDGLRGDAGVVRASLLATAGRRVRWRARLLPTSTLRWMSSATGTFVADLLDRFDEGWAALRRRLHLRGARPA